MEFVDGSTLAHALSGRLPGIVTASMLSQWFPADGGQPSLSEDLQQSTLLGNGDGLRQVIPDSKLIPGVPGLRIGGWREENYALIYNVSGHQDDVLKAWLEVK